MFNVLEVEFQSPEKTRALREILITKLEKGPLLIACDEAHKIEDDAFRTFAVIIQEFITDYYPISVIFAGTPSLQRIFTDSKVTFTSRATKIKINELSPEATKEAFLVPFDNKNVSIESDAINHLVKTSDNFPYFTQLIGDKLWDIVFKQNINIIDINLANKAIDLLDHIRDDFYDDRFKEIKNLPNLSSLAKLIEFVFTNNEEITDTDFDSFITNNSLDIESEESYQILYDLGILWRYSGLIKPGIPSFYSYLIKRKVL